MRSTCQSSVRCQRAVPCNLHGRETMAPDIRAQATQPRYCLGTTQCGGAQTHHMRRSTHVGVMIVTLGHLALPAGGDMSAEACLKLTLFLGKKWLIMTNAAERFSAAVMGLALCISCRTQQRSKSHTGVQRISCPHHPALEPPRGRDTSTLLGRSRPGVRTRVTHAPSLSTHTRHACTRQAAEGALPQTPHLYSLPRGVYTRGSAEQVDL